MLEMEKLQAKGEAGEEELRALKMDVTGKIMLASWRGARLEVIQVLREVRVPQVTLIDLSDNIHFRWSIMSSRNLANQSKFFTTVQGDFSWLVPSSRRRCPTNLMRNAENSNGTFC